MMICEGRQRLAAGFLNNNNNISIISNISPKDLIIANPLFFNKKFFKNLNFIQTKDNLKIMKIILIMGLPGSGKTTLANELAPLLNAKRLNADEVRKEANDWDFSEEGRKRQAKRMSDFALKLKEQGFDVVADFICPTPEARSLFPADYVIWVDTIKEGRFDDTNKMFIKPDKFDFHVTTQDAKNWAPKIFEDIKLK